VIDHHTSDDDARTVLSLVNSEDARSLTVHLDDGTRFEIAARCEEARGLTPGLRLDVVQLTALRLADERKQIARKIFDWLDRRPRSRRDLRRRLIDRGFDAEVSDAVLDSFETQGLVDDRAFAVLWVESQRRRRPVGPAWLVAGLLKQGVSSSIARDVVREQHDTSEDIESAISALRKRRLDLSDRRDRDRGARFLQRRGFPTSTIRRALEQVKEQDRAGTPSPFEAQAEDGAPSGLPLDDES
jgi:regulatory protein